MSKLRIGIVGTGGRVCHHGGPVFARSIETAPCDDLAEVVALCDNRPERVAEAKAIYEKALGRQMATFTDFHRMYAEAGLDAVYVAGPNDLHRDMTVAALDRGLHVLCEKPMEVNLPRCNEMIRAAAKAGRVLALGMQMRYRVRYHKVRELIEQGVIGRPAMVWCTEYRGPFAETKDWVWEKRRSGGAIVEKNCHHYDLFNFWLASEPTAVYASGDNHKHAVIYGRFKSEIVDNAWVVSDYACGARAMVGICFLSETEHRREFGVIGTEGRIFFSLDDNETLHIERGKGEKMTYNSTAVVRGGLFRDFVESIVHGRQPLVSAADGRASLLAPLAAERSLDEKRVVHVSELDGYQA